MTQPRPPCATGRHQGRGDDGVTLIELTAAMAIFALVAVMGLQAISASVRVAGSLSARDATTEELAYALALLRHDLGHVVPVPFTPTTGPVEPALTADSGTGEINLTIGGQSIMPQTHETGIARVEWRFDRADGLLTRRYWTTTAPLDDRAAGPRTVVLKGVDDVSFRLLGNDGWTDGFANAPESPAKALPRAIDVQIRTKAHGDLRVVVAP